MSDISRNHQKTDMGNLANVSEMNDAKDGSDDRLVDELGNGFISETAKHMGEFAMTMADIAYDIDNNIVVCRSAGDAEGASRLRTSDDDGGGDGSDSVSDAISELSAETLEVPDTDSYLEITENQGAPNADVPEITDDEEIIEEDAGEEPILEDGENVPDDKDMTAIDVCQEEGDLEQKKVNTKILTNGDYNDLLGYGRIKHMSDQSNFEQARTVLAEKFGLDVNLDKDVFSSLEAKGSWHDVADGCTLELVDKRIHAAYTHYGGVDLVKNKGDPIAINERDLDGNRIYSKDGEGKKFKSDDFGDHILGNMEHVYKDMKDLAPNISKNIPNPKNNPKHPTCYWMGEPGNSMLKFKNPDCNAFKNQKKYENAKNRYDDLQDAFKEYGIEDEGINCVNGNYDFRPAIVKHNGITCNVAIPYMGKDRVTKK